MALNDIDFVTSWKAISIALTGGFGILGLTKDFRNKHTKKITAWGRVSLIGIIVSSVFGVAAQLKESSDSSAAALKLAQRSGKTLDDIQRLLTPISEPRVQIHYEVNCDFPEIRLRDFDKFCEDVKNAQEQMSHLTIFDNEQRQDIYKMREDPGNWDHWPLVFDSGEFLDISLSFFTDAREATRFLNSTAIRPDLQMRVKSYWKDRSTDKLELTVLDDKAEIVTSTVVSDMSSNEHMASMHDLPGTTLLITSETAYGRFIMPSLRPTSVTITNRQGLSVNIGAFETIGGKIYGAAYRYVFPKDVARPQSNKSSEVPVPASPARGRGTPHAASR
jgi:hypothetical protein